MPTRRDLIKAGLLTSLPSGTRGMANGPWLDLLSPDGHIRVSVGMEAGRPRYSISHDDTPIITPSPLGLDLDGATSDGGWELLGTGSRTRADRRYTLVVGKTSLARDHFNELLLDLRSRSDPHHRMQLIFRAYDDGVAFRYRIPAISDRALVLKAERTGFYFAADDTCWGCDLRKFGTPHEGHFLPVQASRIDAASLFDAPLVCRVGAGTLTFAIAEADLDKYAALYLVARPDAGLGVKVRLSPRLDDPDIAVRLPAGSDLLSSWRVVMIGDHPGRLIESTLITNLNPPCKIADTRWIRPGKAAWDWWSGVSTKAAGGAMDDATMQILIDFAAASNLQYLLIDAGWYPGSTDKDASAEPDVMRSISSIHLPALVEYGRQRDVGLFVWMHWKHLAPRLDEALSHFEQTGIKGVKIDFLDRDDQEMVAFCHRVVARAAACRLMVDLHGAYHPTGLIRTYPNFITQEGVMGAEHNKWGKQVTSRHNVTLAFTRMLLGPMDYTPGGFRNVAPDRFVSRYTFPMVQTTRAQALAMYVVYDSPFSCVSDSPDAYKGQAGFDFLTSVPTSWDETRVLAGEIGEFVVIARRKDDDWYIGAMTGQRSRVVHLATRFLSSGMFTATIYQDGDAPEQLAITEDRLMTARDTLSLRMAANGGGAVRLLRRHSHQRPTRQNDDLPHG